MSRLTREDRRALLAPLHESHRPMSKYDKALYAAWLDGYQRGWENGNTYNWPVTWVLRADYWAWRHARVSR